MEEKSDIQQSAIKTLRMEGDALHALSHTIDDKFELVVKLLLHLDGRLVVTGVGKSAIIAQKLVATFNSTGQPALFMHAADAIHGDLGYVQPGDVVLCISKSGDSPEIKALVPLVKSLGNELIGMYSNASSFLAKHCDYHLRTPIEREACPNNLAPTTSTTAQLAMGDALAVALMEQRGFSSRDFARYHPGGALGKKLYTKVSDLMGDESNPQVSKDAGVRQVIVEISGKRLGATAVVENGKLLGIITDGDLRRMLEKNHDLDTVTAQQIMTASPKTIAYDALAVEAFHLMEQNSITTLIVLHKDQYKGIIHLHDILKEGIF
ncbi:MAG TPA: KpsF/GutQ family sugar-phosphate isomerase [Flavobacteriales bacterium]